MKPLFHLTPALWWLVYAGTVLLTSMTMPVVCRCGGPALAPHALLSIAPDRPIPLVESLARSGGLATNQSARPAPVDVATGQDAAVGSPLAREMPSAVELVIGLVAVAVATVALVVARPRPPVDRPWLPAGRHYPPPAPPPRPSSLPLA
jgi:hypothetical protein